MPQTRNISWAKPFLGEDERRLLLEAYDSTWISGGAYIERFEREFSTYLQVDHGVTTSSCTTALYLAFIGLDIGQGDDVIVPGFGFMAAANMAIAVGARPVFVDVDQNTWCIDPQKVAAAITPNTKAIVAVHTYGNVCDMTALNALAKKYKIKLIEDTAEACFSMYESCPAGTLGDIGCFSFQATKTLAMGEGGYVSTRNHELYARMQLIRNHGMQGSKRYWHHMIGHNFRLPNLQAAIGCGQLAKRHVIRTARKELFDLYRVRVSQTHGVTVQTFGHYVDPCVWTMAVRFTKDHDANNRNAIMQSMHTAGIETRPGFYTPSQMPIYTAKNIPVSEMLANSIICLPFYVGLKDDDVNYVCEVLQKCLN